MENLPSGSLPTSLLLLLILSTASLVVLLLLRPRVVDTNAGKILAFWALLLLPLLALHGGVSVHLEHSKKTEFCLSCHTMERYGRSLLIDDSTHIPAVHFQNNLVARKTACYTCHTDYTLFGGIKAKLRGVRQVYTQYFGRVPERLQLSGSYNNRECLQCHSDSRSFEENPVHNAEPETMVSIRSNSLSCMGCHDLVHDIANLQDANLWKRPVR